MVQYWVAAEHLTHKTGLLQADVFRSLGLNA